MKGRRTDWLAAVWPFAPLAAIGGWLLAGAVLVTVLAPAVRDAIALMAGG